MTEHNWKALGLYRYVCETCGTNDVSQVVCGVTPERQALLDIITAFDSDITDSEFMVQLQQIIDRFRSE